MKLIAVALLLLSANIVRPSPVDSVFPLDTEIAPQAAGDEHYKLGTEIVPKKYVLTFTPYFEGEKAFTFEGNAKIWYRNSLTDRNMDNITLHMNDIVITRFRFTSTGAHNLTTATYDAVTDKLVIPFQTPMAAETEGYIEIDYVGQMRDDMAGFYRSYYYEGVGTDRKKVWMATTQLQSTDARRAFPCFDEPGFKARFQIIMNTPKGMNTVTNTRLHNTTDVLKEDGTVDTTRDKHIFQETIPLSTYLIAFIVSKYERNANAANNFGVISRPDAINATKVGLAFGQEMLAKLGEYLDLTYYSMGDNLKMDMAAIPDFSAGAMENFGLLTYRETSSLHYDDDTPSINEQRIKAVIAHEQAHMWFGDWVTCKWWSATWLNEGFARYFQYFGTEMVQKGWELEEQFVVENLQQSMLLDSTDSTHPMTNPLVFTKREASDMFDNISYNKGASIIRMLKTHIGEAKFQETIRSYLKDFGTQAVEPAHLLEKIRTINGNETFELIRGWTVKPGFPLVTVSRVNRTLTLSQHRFMRSAAGNNKTERYDIPITYNIDSEDLTNTTTMFFFFDHEADNKTHELPKVPTKYYILNPRQTGFYRVNYDAANWAAIKTALNSTGFDGIPVMTRSQIVDDLFNLARAGVVPYNTAIDIIRYLKKETHYIPWLSAINHGLTFLSQRVSPANSEHSNLFSWFITNTMDDVYKHLTFDEKASETRTEVYNRVQIRSWLCKYGHADCIAKSNQDFAAFMETPTTKIHKNKRAHVYCNGVRNGNATHFNFLYERYNQTDILQEQLNLLAGMACTKNKDLITKYLDLIVSGDVRIQDQSSTISNIMNANIEGPNYLYTYITENHAKWSETMGGLGQLTSVAGRFTSAAQFTAYEAWLEAQKTALGDAHSTLITGVAAAKKNLEWDNEFMPQIMAHLKALNSATSKAISVLISVITLTVLYIFN